MVESRREEVGHVGPDVWSERIAEQNPLIDRRAGSIGH